MAKIVQQMQSVLVGSLWMQQHNNIMVACYCCCPVCAWHSVGLLRRHRAVCDVGVFTENAGLWFTQQQWSVSEKLHSGVCSQKFVQVSQNAIPV